MNKKKRDLYINKLTFDKKISFWVNTKVQRILLRSNQIVYIKAEKKMIFLFVMFQLSLPKTCKTYVQKD